MSPERIGKINELAEKEFKHLPYLSFYFKGKTLMVGVNGENKKSIKIFADLIAGKNLGIEVKPMFGCT